MGQMRKHKIKKRIEDHIMEIDIRSIRESYGLEVSEFADRIGLKPAFYYYHYETKNELPSKYVYRLWRNLDNFPLPEDFFHYTSFVLLVNMHYHHMTQKDVAKMFDIPSQPTLSGYMQYNIPMYEKKEYFLRFDPFIVPFIVPRELGESMQKITELAERGNFMPRRKKNKIKEESKET